MPQLSIRNRDGLDSQLFIYKLKLAKKQIYQMLTSTKTDGKFEFKGGTVNAKNTVVPALFLYLNN